MRKIILSIAITFLAIISVNAQSSETGNKPFKVDLSLGYAIPSGSGAKSGALFALEPKYAVAPNISIGLRLEAAVTVSGTSISNSNLSSSTYKAQASASYIITGDYYFSTEDFKPFVGVGIGPFTTAGLNVQNGSVANKNVAASTKFGGMIRAGFEYKHLRFGIEYNLVSNTTVPPSSSSSNDGYDIKNSYLGIKLGVLIGGGRK